MLVPVTTPDMIKVLTCPENFLATCQLRGVVLRLLRSQINVIERATENGLLQWQERLGSAEERRSFFSCCPLLCSLRLYNICATKYLLSQQADFGCAFVDIHQYWRRQTAANGEQRILA